MSKITMDFNYPLFYIEVIYESTEHYEQKEGGGSTDMEIYLTIYKFPNNRWCLKLRNQIVYQLKEYLKGLIWLK